MLHPRKRNTFTFAPLSCTSLAHLSTVAVAAGSKEGCRVEQIIESSNPLRVLLSNGKQGKLVYRSECSCGETKMDKKQSPHHLMNAASPAFRKMSTTEVKANHSGISSPALSRLRNSVPDNFTTFTPNSFALLSCM